MPRNPKKIKWNFLLAILVNNGMKNMKGYRVSSVYGEEPENRKRHIQKNSLYLCSYKGNSMNRTLYSLYNYSINFIEGIPNVLICKICLNKLPIKVKEEFIYNWTITKLKVK